MRPAPPAPDSPRARSVAELEHMDVERGAYGTGRAAWISRALVSPIWHLGPAELRLLLDAGHGVRWLLPVVLERLETEPLTAVDGDNGALLAAALRAPVSDWLSVDPKHTRLHAVCANARRQIAELPPVMLRELREDLDAADALFTT